MIITQGTDNIIKLPLSEYFTQENLRTIIAAEVAFGATSTERVRKLWYKDDKSKSTMELDRINNTLNIGIYAAETAKWRYQVPIQIRIKKRNNEIVNSIIFYANINTALSTEEF